jgi:hypothetical protein
VDSFASKQIFRVDNRQEEQRSTKGQRRTTTMKAIKCLLLLVAVLALAAMNAAAMNDTEFFYRLWYDGDLESAANKSTRSHEEYVAGEHEDAETCRDAGTVNFVQCKYCCIKLSFDKKERWDANRDAYRDYKRLCTCVWQRDQSPPTKREYDMAVKALAGDVEDP